MKVKVSRIDLLARFERRERESEGGKGSEKGRVTEGERGSG